MNRAELFLQAISQLNSIRGYENGVIPVPSAGTSPAGPVMTVLSEASLSAMSAIDMDSLGASRSF